MAWIPPRSLTGWNEAHHLSIPLRSVRFASLLGDGTMILPLPRVAQIPIQTPVTAPKWWADYLLKSSRFQRRKARALCSSVTGFVRISIGQTLTHDTHKSLLGAFDIINF